MKLYGIIAEYNPFHNGHARLIEKTRENGATHIAAVMSGDFVQRGDVAVIDKFRRAQIAVDNGVDLVVELPAHFSLAVAETFARAGIFFLGALGADAVSFGSECGDIELLKSALKAAKAVHPGILVHVLNSGSNYPNAFRELVARENAAAAKVFDGPNNTLAIEYLKAIEYLGLDMEAFTVPRDGSYHDAAKPSGIFASGSTLRKLIESGGDISPFVPPDMARTVARYREAGRLASFAHLERALLYKLRTSSKQEIADLPDVGQGLQNRIFEAGRTALSIGQFFESAKTNRYTAARIRRVLLNLFIGIKKNDLSAPPSYGRILAFNSRGAEILKNRADSSIPFSASIKKLFDDGAASGRAFEIALRAADIYGIASPVPLPCGTDFTAQIKIQTKE
jgi:predicted nucleotidyltransferase